MRSRNPLLKILVKPHLKHLWRFVLIAFVASVLLPFFAVYNTGQLSAANAKTALFAGRLLICTADGFRWIKLSDVGKQQPHTPLAHYQCALCFFAAHGLKHVALFAGVLLACIVRISLARRLAAAAAALRLYRPHLQHSRAPPSFSF